MTIAQYTKSEGGALMYKKLENLSINKLKSIIKI